MATFVALHGFLGLPSDWDFLAGRFPENPLLAPDLFDSARMRPEEGLRQAADMVNQMAASAASPKILIGYSLGARIALHALPGAWAGAVLISPHPGIAFEEERKERVLHDQQWAERFLSTPWDELISAWDSQKVFSRPGLPRREMDFTRTQLFRALTGWSLGKQEDLRPFVKSLDLPVLWITGEEDIKFTTIAKSVQLSNPLSRHAVIPQAGHRVPWENESEFSRELKLFINSINQRMDHDGRSSRLVAGNQNVRRH